MTNLGVVFPGQGSQSVGMLAALNAAYPLVQQTFAEASDAVGLDLWKLVQSGPDAVLNDTRNTQPALLAAGVAVWRVWQIQGGLTPALMAGHSLGEYSALVCAEALEFGDAVKLVAERARLMQDAVPPGQGAMAAVLGLEDEQVREVCIKAAAGEIVTAVNFNAPGQVVIAGQSTAVARACELAKSAGAKRTLPLPVSVPSHCALMQPAAEKLAEYLKQVNIAPPKIPVLHNATVEIASDPERIRILLTMQLYSPVRWVETIQMMAIRGINTLIEAGPGKVLVGLNKRINNIMRPWPVFDPNTLDQAIQEATRGT